MKAIAVGLFSLLSLGVFAQEIEEEFLPINVEGKEAFMSTKTGEFTFREHAKTDATQLKTTASGVVYTDISFHTVKKGETLSSIAKKNEVSIDEIKKHNEAITTKLKIGTDIKIVKKELVKSSSPVVGYAGEKRIIAKLRPGETPGQFAAPPSVEEVESKVIETKKTEEKPSATVYKAETSIKNPIFGLEDEEESTVAVKENVEAINKKQRLARLRAEMKALEEELEEDVVKEEIKDEEVTDLAVPAPETIEAKENTDVQVLERVKESNLEAEIEESSNGKKVMVFENKAKEAVSTADKAKDAIASVRKTEKEVEDKKTEAVENEKEDLKKSVSEDNNEEAYYIVEKGNSLWSIAKKHNMTVDAIKKLNNLKNNNLDIGQKLKVTPKK